MVDGGSLCKGGTSLAACDLDGARRSRERSRRTAGTPSCTGVHRRGAADAL